MRLPRSDHHRRRAGAAIIDRSSHDRVTQTPPALPGSAGLSNTEGAARRAGFVRDFRPAPTTRTPFELVWHMTGVIGYARTFLHGGDFEPPRLGSFAEEIARFHETLGSLSGDFADPSLTARITDEQFLQGPLADAMTHAGQLAMLRRMHGSPVPSENFIFAKVSDANLSSAQALPAAPDEDWRPEDPPQPPGPRRRRRSLNGAPCRSRAKRSVGSLPSSW